MSAGCTISRTSGQEDLGRGIVRGTLRAQLARDVCVSIPAYTVSFKGQVTGVEDGCSQHSWL
jgi:hypothetical protein